MVTDKEWEKFSEKYGMTIGEIIKQYPKEAKQALDKLEKTNQTIEQHKRLLREIIADHTQLIEDYEHKLHWAQRRLETAEKQLAKFE